MSNLKNNENQKLLKILLAYSFVAVLFFPEFAFAWNPKDLFTGAIDTISYILATIWGVVLIILGVKRQLLFFSLVFVFGGVGLAMLNSVSRDYVVQMMGKMVRAFLNA